MLPKTYHEPARIFEAFGIDAVPLGVSGQLGPPVAAIRQGGAPVVGAAVPKTPVHEDSHPTSRERKVRTSSPAGHGDRKIHSKPPSATMKGRPESTLRARVATTI